MRENGLRDIRDAELRPCPDQRQKLYVSTREGTLSRDEMERRRMEAGEDMLNGFPQSRVPRKFGVSRTTASRWHFAVAANGLDSLRGRKSPGRPSRITPEQKAQIVEAFDRGAAALGFAGNRWTAALLARVIEERFGVHYSLDHIGRLMSKLRAHRCTDQLRSTREMESNGNSPDSR